MAAVVHIKLHSIVFGQPRSTAPEDSDIGSTEPIDRLLRITDSCEVLHIGSTQIADEL